MDGRFDHPIDLLRDVGRANPVAVAILHHREPDAARVLLEQQSDRGRSADRARSCERRASGQIPRPTRATRSIDDRGDARDADARKDTE